MTREEVINVLKKYEVYGCGVCLQDDLQNNLDAKEALDMAIEALSAEPSGDLISRADLMKEFAERVKESNNSDYIEPPNWNDAVSLVGSMPSVSADRPSGEWIPLIHDTNMTTNFPHERDGQWVIVTDGKSISVERIKKDAYDHFYPNGRWFELEHTTAWMPLPKPYGIMKGGNE